MLKREIAMAAAGLLVLLAGCAEKEEILPGERIAVADSVLGATPPARAAATPVALPAPVANADWGQPGGNAAHRGAHVALRVPPAPLWSVPIGAGDGKRTRITAEPAVAGGRVFTLDSAGQVTATSTAGQVLWQASVVPASDPGGQRPGGGIAATGGTVYVGTEYGEVVALDAATGGIRWRQRFDGPVTAPPAVAGDRLYVVARDASAWAIDARDGKVIWTLTGVPSPSGVTGGAAPAVGDNLVVFPFSSGGLIATRAAGGSTAWEAQVVGQRKGRAWSGITDITADPVIEGGILYTGNQSGRTVAIRLADGTTIWEAEEGSFGPVALAGNAVFFVNDESNLVRLDKSSGATVWKVPLSYYFAEKERKRNAIQVHFGPVLAGARLVLASTDGTLSFYDPTGGGLVAQVALPAGAASAPVVAGQTLYVVTRDGMLHAFR